MIGHLVRRAQLIGELAVDAAVALLYMTGAIRDPSRPEPTPAPCSEEYWGALGVPLNPPYVNYVGEPVRSRCDVIASVDGFPQRCGLDADHFVVCDFRRHDQSSSVGVGPQPPTEESPESPSPDVETQGTPFESPEAFGAATDWPLFDAAELGAMAWYLLQYSKFCAEGVSRDDFKAIQRVSWLLEHQSHSKK